MLHLRHLAAIMFTDIVGYTAIMGSDEKKAFELLSKNRTIQKPIIEKHGGKWIKELGDGVMASFSTVSDAVAAAIEIKEACNVAQDFQLRIGIHQGEIVSEENDIFGDAVNIASRIQAAARPDSICISEAVYRIINNKKDIRTKFIKEESLKNVKDPVKIYEVVTNESEHDSVTKPVTNLGKSVAVLPFLNLSTDPEQEYFCDGIAEEIINALAQLNNLRVIARTSAFAFKDKHVDVREIGKVLDAQTLLEGSVRKSGNRLRITTKLIKSADGSHLWSENYDRVVDDIFSIQEDIAGKVAIALRGVLTEKEKEAIRRPETNFEAYEFYLKGRQLFNRVMIDDAKKMYLKAIQLDPDYALVHSGLADLHSWLYEWEGANKNDLELAVKHSQQAMTLAPDMSESHASRGYALALALKHEEAKKEFQKAIELNPNSYDAYYLYGRSSFANGEFELSADMFLKAGEVRREDFQSMLLGAQSMKTVNKDSGIEVCREGVRRARKYLELYPDDKRVLSLASHYLYELGNTEEKEEAMNMINRALELYPEDVSVLVNGACFFAVLGYKERALDMLEKVFGKGYGKKEWIVHDKDYDSLRDEPRFKALLGKLQ